MKEQAAPLILNVDDDPGGRYVISRVLRHAGYQVRDEHYETVGEALLWTLGRGLGAAFTAETQAAWAKTYWTLAETMKAGARDGATQHSRVA